MEYSFRPNLFQKSRRVRLSEDSLEVLNEQRHVQYRVPFSRIQKIRMYPSGSVVDPKRGRCEMKHCIISFGMGRSVVLKSASYTGPHTGLDHTRDYQSFVGKLLHLIAQKKPNTPVINGSMGVVVAWVFVGMLAAALLVLGVVMLLSPLVTQHTFADVIAPAALCCIGGFAVSLMSLNMYQTYLPDRTTAAERAGFTF